MEVEKTSEVIESAATSLGPRPGSSSHCMAEEGERHGAALLLCLQEWERGGMAGCTSILCRVRQHPSQLGFWGQSSCFPGLICVSVCPQRAAPSRRTTI